MRCVHLLLIGVLATAGAQASPPADIDPQADRVLRAMVRHLAGLKQFSAKTENTIEVVTQEGQKIQFTIPATLTVSRPNKFLAERRGDIVDQAFYYDGKSLTLHQRDTGHYATVAAPATIDEALDFARLQLDVIAPGADLIDTRAYERLTDDASSGQYLGIVVVGGHRCHHLAYRAAEVDWQLWVREGNEPLPCKYVITSKEVTGAPQFTLHVIEWNSAPKIASNMFDFTPPKDAKRIEFLPVAEGAP